MDYFSEVVCWISRKMAWMAGAALVVMTIFICVHVLLRALFRSPIEGAVEITGYLATIVIPFAIAYVAVERRHIIVDLFVRRLSLKDQAIIDSIIGMISTVIFALMAGYNTFYGTKLWQRGEISTGLRIPFFIFVYGLAFCCAIMSLVLWINSIESFKKGRRG